MSKNETFVKVTITDPDIAVRIDGVHVRKIRSVDNREVERWDLEDYRSKEIDLKNGKFYLSLLPYWRQIDPLPVWFRTDNEGTTNLLVKCILTEGKPGFKHVTTLKGGKGVNIAGCYKIEYRVLRHSLRNLSILFVDGIGRRYMDKIVKSTGIMDIGNLAGKDALNLSKTTGIRVTKLAELIRKAEIACAIRVNEDDYETISDKRIIELLNSSVDDLASRTNISKEKIEALMDTLGDLVVAIDDRYIRKLALVDLFE